MSQCVALFNQKLSNPIKPQDRDPLWATALLLGVVTFASCDASRPEEAWPPRASDPSDLDWLRLVKGKSIIWDIADPLRKDSIFRPMAKEFAEIKSPLPRVGTDGLSQSLVDLCALESSSTSDSSPYWTAAHVLTQLQNLSSNEITVPRMLSFFGHLQPSFKTLLRQKDPVALVLLALWYARASIKVWWIERRAQVEYEAIYLYLERYHSSNTNIRRLLPRNFRSIRPLQV